MLLALCLAVRVFAADYLGILLLSNYSRVEFQGLSEFSFPKTNEFSIETVTYSERGLDYLLETNFRILFDASESVEAGYQLQLLRSTKNFILVHCGSELQHRILKPCEFYLHPSPSDELAAFGQLVEELSWNTFHLICTSSSVDCMAYFRYFDAESEIDLADYLEQELFDLYIARAIKPTGDWKVLVLNEAAGASKIFSSYNAYGLYTAGSAIVAGPRAVWGSYDLGMLVLAEEGMESATSRSDYEYLAIIKFLNLLDASQVLIANQCQLLEDRTMNRRPEPVYTLLNFLNATNAVQVGVITTQQVTLTNTIVYPGNTSETDAVKTIQFTANTGATLPPETHTAENTELFVAVAPMVDFINADPDMLPNFQLVMHETDCYPTREDRTWPQQCIELNIDDLGLFYIDGFYETATKKSISKMNELGVYIPVTGILYNKDEMYDPEQYPTLLVTTPEFIHLFSIIPVIMTSFGWHSVIVIFNTEIDEKNYNIFMEIAEKAKLEILNDVEHQFIPESYTPDDYADYAHIFEYIVNLPGRIILNLAWTPADLYISQGLYDAGLRKGDVVMVYLIKPYANILRTSTFSHDPEKVYEVSDGSISFFIPEYVGEYGESLAEYLTPLIAPKSTAYTCMQVDSFLLGVHAINSMLELGKNFEDSAALNNFMRYIRFTGCSGTVAIDGSTNGRSYISFSIQNLYSTDTGWEEPIVGEYTIGVTVPLQISSDIIWPDGTTTTPSDMKDTFEPCGFDPNSAELNTTSRVLAVVISAALVVCASLCVKLLYRRLLTEETPLLTEETEMMFEDGVMMILGVIEGVQYVAVGPDIGQIDLLMSALASLVTINLENLIEFKFEMFWIGLRITMIGTLAWMICLALTLLRVHEKIPLFLGDVIEFYGFKMTPIIANGAFIGIIVILLKVFQCERSTSAELEDSFLRNDCTYQCWSESHLVYLALCSVLILVYSVTAILCRPVSEHMQGFANIKVFKNYSLSKSIVQLILILLTFHVKNFYPFVHAVLFSIVMVLWTVVMFRLDLYNYERMTMWQRLIMLGVCWSSLDSLIKFALPDSNYWSYVMLGIKYAVWLGLAVIGLFLQRVRYKSLLYRKPGVDTNKLFVFAFTNRIAASDLTEKRLDYIEDPDDISSAISARAGPRPRIEMGQINPNMVSVANKSED